MFWQESFPGEVFDRLMVGGDEKDVVNSGLEETLVHAYRGLRKIGERHKDEIDLRTAAFIHALRKVADNYIQLGIFP